MEEIAEVYSRSLFEVAQEHDVLDRVHDELGEFADALDDNRDLQVFFFSPYFSAKEKKEGIEQVGRRRGRAVRPLPRAAGRAPPAAGDLPHRREYDRMWAEENKLLEVSVTTAVKLDEEVVRDIGKRIEEQTGRHIELSSTIDPGIVGGLVLRVGNMIMDASLKARLERLRKQVARGA